MPCRNRGALADRSTHRSAIDSPESGLSARLSGPSQTACAPHDPQCRVAGRTWFDPLLPVSLTVIERSGALVGCKMFDIQPVNIGRQLPDEGIEKLRAEPTASMIGVNVELVHHVVGRCRGPADRGSARPVSGRWRHEAAGQRDAVSRRG